MVAEVDCLVPALSKSDYIHYRYERWDQTRLGHVQLAWRMPRGEGRGKTTDTDRTNLMPWICDSIIHDATFAGASIRGVVKPGEARKSDSHTGRLECCLIYFTING